MLQAGGRGCHELTRDLAYMVHHEPVVQSALRLLQSYCLVGGIQLRYGGTTPPTPRFAQHLQRHYLPFCRAVIESFMTVGFAPYRIRTLENGARIPEVLPLGTYTWYVARNLNNMGQWASLKMEEVRTVRAHIFAWGVVTPNVVQDTSGKDPSTLPFLRYEINSMYCSDPIFVYEFTPPHALFLCSSPMTALLKGYEQLLHKRECAMRADQFNASPSVVMERHSKVTLNDISKSGHALLDTEVKGANNEKRASAEGQMGAVHTSLENMQTRTRLPDETVTLIAPSEYAVHSLDRVLTPQEVMREELAFARHVASSFGVPSSLLLQGSTAVGGSGGSGGGAMSWNDGFEGSNRLLLDTCRHVNMHVEAVLYDAYRKIYNLSATHAPSFKLPLVPTVPFDQLMTAYQTQLVDDHHVSLILESMWGVPLGKDARGVREQQQKAEYVLPFKDKKDAPSTK